MNAGRQIAGVGLSRLETGITPLRRRVGMGHPRARHAEGECDGRRSKRSRRERQQTATLGAKPQRVKCARRAKVRLATLGRDGPTGTFQDGSGAGLPRPARAGSPREQRRAHPPWTGTGHRIGQVALAGPLLEFRPAAPDHAPKGAERHVLALRLTSHGSLPDAGATPRKRQGTGPPHAGASPATASSRASASRCARHSGETCARYRAFKMAEAM